MNYYTLYELNNHLKQVLGQHLAPSYWIVAEIGEMRINRRGHCYMELVEKEDEHLHARMKANIWAYNFRNISGWFEAITGQSLQPGMKILAHVIVDFHEVYGLSLNIRDIDPNFTLGERARKRQEVIDQLVSDGVFEMNKVLELPLVPQRIALVSSPTAAGFGDFTGQLSKNDKGYAFNVTLFKATMQGNEAKQSVIDAMLDVYDMIDNFDLVVIIRGGGAQIDLDCFDTYDMAAHVSQFPLPVITGIGHERDQTVVDLVAHTSLKTPTAVSSFLISGMDTYEQKIVELTERLAQCTENQLKQCHYELTHIIQKFSLLSRQNLSFLSHNLSAFHSRMKLGVTRNLKQHVLLMEKLTEAIKSRPLQYLQKENDKLNQLEKNINLVNPENVLKRGYSISHINNVLLKNIKALAKGNRVTTETYDKRIESIIESIKLKNNEQ